MESSSAGCRMISGSHYAELVESGTGTGKRGTSHQQDPSQRNGWKMEWPKNLNGANFTTKTRLIDQFDVISSPNQISNIHRVKIIFKAVQKVKINLV